MSSTYLLIALDKHNGNVSPQTLLRHVSVQSHHLQGGHYLCLLKLHFVKTVSYGSVQHTHINKDSFNICSHITTDLITHRRTIIDYFNKE